MDGNAGRPKPFSALIIEVAAILIPVVALVALVGYLTWGDDDSDAGLDDPPLIREIAQGGGSTPGGEPTAARADAPAAFVGEAAGAGAGDGEAGGAGAQQDEAVSDPDGAAPEEEEAEAEPRPEKSLIVWVRKGETIEIVDQPRGAVVARQGQETSFGSPTVYSVKQTTENWIGVSTPDLPNGELGWIRADPALLKAGYVDYSVVVDLSERSAELFNGPESVRSWPVTVGAPGTETPTGEFGVTDTFRGGLDEPYGCCAVALSATQPNLPSGWAGGNRIAFHGTDGPIGIAGSSGCIRSRDADVSRLVSTLPLGTPVTIRD